MQSREPYSFFTRGKNDSSFFHSIRTRIKNAASTVKEQKAGQVGTQTSDFKKQEKHILKRLASTPISDKEKTKIKIKLLRQKMKLRAGLLENNLKNVGQKQREGLIVSYIEQKQLDLEELKKYADELNK